MCIMTIWCVCLDKLGILAASRGLAAGPLTYVDVLFSLFLSFSLLFLPTILYSVLCRKREGMWT